MQEPNSRCGDRFQEAVGGHLQSGQAQACAAADRPGVGSRQFRQDKIHKRRQAHDHAHCRPRLHILLLRFETRASQEFSAHHSPADRLWTRVRRKYSIRAHSGEVKKFV